MKRFLISLAALLLLACGVTNPELANLTITNGLSISIMEINFRMPNPDDQHPDWGENLLEDNLGSGESVVFKVSPGLYDIRCIDAESSVYLKTGAEITMDGYSWLVVSD